MSLRARSGEYKKRHPKLPIYTDLATSHPDLRRDLANLVLKCPEHKGSVVSPPTIGGSFGMNRRSQRGAARFAWPRTTSGRPWKWMITALGGFLSRDGRRQRTDRSWRSTRTAVPRVPGVVVRKPAPTCKRAPPAYTATLGHARGRLSDAGELLESTAFQPPPSLAVLSRQRHGRKPLSVSSAWSIARRRKLIWPAERGGKLHPASGRCRSRPSHHLHLRQREFEKGMYLALKEPTGTASPNARPIEKERQIFSPPAMSNTIDGRQRRSSRARKSRFEPRRHVQSSPSHQSGPGPRHRSRRWWPTSSASIPTPSINSPGDTDKVFSVTSAPVARVLYDVRLGDSTGGEKVGRHAKGQIAAHTLRSSDAINFDEGIRLQRQTTRPGRCMMSSADSFFNPAKLRR